MGWREKGEVGHLNQVCEGPGGEEGDSQGEDTRVWSPAEAESWQAAARGRVFPAHRAASTLAGLQRQRGWNPTAASAAPRSDPPWDLPWQGAASCCSGGFTLPRLPKLPRALSESHPPRLAPGLPLLRYIPPSPPHLQCPAQCRAHSYFSVNSTETGYPI